MNKVGEKELRYIVNETCETLLREYLDNNLMAPLRNYLKRGRKKYTWYDLQKMYRDEQLKDKDIITTRMAFQDYDVFKNGWVLHFTNNPFQIIANGFKGIDKEFMYRIWRTYGTSMPRVPEGYAFAFDANDVLPNNAIDYGEYALMFRTSGLKVTNLGDSKQKQVVFNSKLANMKNCFLLRFDTSKEANFDDTGESHSITHIDGVSVINPYTKKAVYKAKNIEQAVQWVETNDRQYSSTSTFNNVGNLRNRDNMGLEVIKKVVEYFEQNFKGRYAIEPLYNNGGRSFMSIVYENTMENAFPIRPFLEYFNSIKTDDVECQTYQGGDWNSQCVWRSKYGDAPINAIFGHKYSDLNVIMLTKKNSV